MTLSDKYTQMLGCSNTRYHNELGASGGAVRPEATGSQPMPGSPIEYSIGDGYDDVNEYEIPDLVDNNFEVKATIPASVEDFRYNDIAATPEMLADPEMLAKKPDDSDLKLGGPATKSMPQRGSDGIKEVSQVNENETVAQLIQANSRIKALEKLLEEQKAVIGQQRDRLDQYEAGAKDLVEAKSACDKALAMVLRLQKPA